MACVFQPGETSKFQTGPILYDGAIWTPVTLDTAKGELYVAVGFGSPGGCAG